MEWNQWVQSEKKELAKVMEKYGFKWKDLEKHNISQKIKNLFANEGMEPRDLFDKNSEYIKKIGSNPFAEEIPITLLAKEWIGKLKTSVSEAFDPLA